MAFGARLTLLEETDFTTMAQQERLATIGITSVEELIDAIDASVRSVADLLGVSVEQTRSLRDRASHALSKERRQQLERTERKRYPLGALPPRKGGR